MVLSNKYFITLFFLQQFEKFANKSHKLTILKFLLGKKHHKT
jgi:hypothetical protein